MSDWTLSHEREFMEKLVNTRLGFLLLLVSVVPGLASQIQDELLRALILTVATVIAFMISSAVMRAQKKLEINFDLLIEREPNHPAVEIDKKAGEKFSRRRWVGFGIPTLSVAIMGIAALAAWLMLSLPD